MYHKINVPSSGADPGISVRGGGSNFPKILKSKKKKKKKKEGEKTKNTV